MSEIEAKNNRNLPYYQKNIFRTMQPNLISWANLYLKLQVKNVKSENTFRTEKRNLNNFTDFFSDHHQSFDVRKWVPGTTQQFIENLLQKNKKPKTIKLNLVFVKILARFVRENRPEFLPFGDPTKGIRAPVQEALRPKGLNEQQVKDVIDAAYGLIYQEYEEKPWYEKGYKKVRRPFRDFAVMMVLLNGGLRREEVCTIKYQYLEDKYLKNVKCKGNIYRNILLGRETLLAIRTYIKEERHKDVLAFPESSALFLPSAHRSHLNRSGCLSPSTISAIVQKVANAVNEELSPEQHIKLHPHMFRHTHAYQILKTGKNLAYLQKRLGHQSFKYLALYAQMPEDEEKELVDNAEFVCNKK